LKGSSPHSRLVGGCCSHPLTPGCAPCFPAVASSSLVGIPVDGWGDFLNFLVLSFFPSPRTQVATSLTHLLHGWPPEHFVRIDRHLTHAWATRWRLALLLSVSFAERREVGWVPLFRADVFDAEVLPSESPEETGLFWNPGPICCSFKGIVADSGISSRRIRHGRRQPMSLKSLSFSLAKGALC
jgi:hypothetical protein